jgi:hypothetical protein
LRKVFWLPRVILVATRKSGAPVTRDMSRQANWRKIWRGISAPAAARRSLRWPCRIFEDAAMKTSTAATSRVAPGSINALAAIAIQLAHLRLRHWWPILSETLGRARAVDAGPQGVDTTPAEQVLGLLLGYTARRWQHVCDERFAADLASLGFWDSRDRQFLAGLDVEARAIRLLAGAIADFARATHTR